MLVFAAAVLFWLDRQGGLLYAGADGTRYDGQRFRVVAVVDGDTVDLGVGDGGKPTTRVRLWGIDTPEVGRRGQRSEPGADDATDRVRVLALGQTVTVSLEPHRIRDRYGRLLAFLELPDGSVLNEKLLIEGLAHSDGRWPHRHVERYARLQEQAEFEGRGLWAD